MCGNQEKIKDNKGIKAQQGKNKEKQSPKITKSPKKKRTHEYTDRLGRQRQDIRRCNN